MKIIFFLTIANKFDSDEILPIMKITNLKFDCFNKNLESDKFDWNVQFLLILQSPFGTCTE